MKMQRGNKNIRLKITGRVVQGDKYGRVLGFPTANLDRRQYLRQAIKIKLGIWAGSAKIETTQAAAKIRKKISQPVKIWKAGIIIGPLDQSSPPKPKIEAHLIGFSGNLYGKKMILHLKKYLRPFKRYKNEQQLKDQIKKDIKAIKALKF
jgi:riboflavin kinase/FMN adenylyltransferase